VNLIYFATNSEFGATKDKFNFLRGHHFYKVRKLEKNIKIDFGYPSNKDELFNRICKMGEKFLNS